MGKDVIIACDFDSEEKTLAFLDLFAANHASAIVTDHVGWLPVGQGAVPGLRLPLPVDAYQIQDAEHQATQGQPEADEEAGQARSRQAVETRGSG